VEVFRFQPSAQTGIVNLRLTLPEIRLEIALDPQVIQLQLDGCDVPWEVATDVADAHVQTGYHAAFAMCLDHHTHLPFNF
jgi:hypothetical protein